MTSARFSLAGIRRSCGAAYRAVRDHGFSITRTTVFERQSDSQVRSLAPVAFRFGGADDLMSFTQEIHNYGAAAKEFGLERLAAGDSLVIGEWEGAVVFYGWLMYGRMDLDQDVPVPLPPDVAYSYKLYTVHRARGLRICAGFYQFVGPALDQRGYHRLVCRIAPGNRPSIRGHIRVGFQPRGTLWKLVAARHALYFADRSMRSWLRSITPNSPFAGTRLLPKGLPVRKPAIL